MNIVYKYAKLVFVDTQVWKDIERFHDATRVAMALKNELPQRRKSHQDIIAHRSCPELSSHRPADIISRFYADRYSDKK